MDLPFRNRLETMPPDNTQRTLIGVTNKIFGGNMMNIRKFLMSAAVTAFAAVSHAQPGTQTLVFAVNEGVTYRTGSEVIRQNYKAITDDLSRLLKAKIRLDVVGDYATLEKDLSAKAYDIAFIHPSHITIAPVKRGTYTLAAVSKAHVGYKASFLTKMNAQPKTPEELGKLLAQGIKPVGSPDTNSITAWLIRATLRDAAAAAKTTAPTLKFTRFQDSIPFMVENGFVDVAGTASEAVVKEWVAGGGKVLTTSRPVPIKNVIVSNTMSKESLDIVKNYFLELSESAEGQAKLERISLKQGFVVFDQAAFVALGAWLGL
ncbi:MAG: phosphate ABC transporter substrate-binding protein [Betaproteobacteria bacterium]|nr:MAG: phosphate ABC transporter substrate-binding protein [Betaproteobacteria bacterium]